MAMIRETLLQAIEALKAGRTPSLPAEDFPPFSEPASKGNAHLGPDALEALAQSLTQADIPTFERALRAIDEGDLAWLGFKVVYDAQAAQSNVDNAVTKKYGDTGSADGQPLVFFCNDAKEIVSSRQPSDRDLFQMKDATRGPSMHNEQFEGLIWTSVALFEPVRVWLLGATDASSEVCALAAHVGFKVVAVDCDPSYLNEGRFEAAERILLEGDNFDGLADLSASPKDYVCVLTRGHMFDPEGCIWAVRQGVRYIGMMGCAGKNSTVYGLVREAGVSDEDWERIKRPIGLKFGAKTPAELAIAIVAELVDVRYRDRYSEEARAKHDAALGR
jgi:xanthine dehydrogenase accessory factor